MIFFSRMIIYGILFIILSFCESTRIRVTGNFAKLVLVQRFSITKFFYEDIHRPDLNTSSSEFVEYLREHKTIFQEKEWVLHGLWPLDANNKLLKNCIVPSRDKLSFNYNNLVQDLKDDLKKEWPVLTINGKDNGNMEVEYREYGSCVTTDASSYFRKALQLLRKYNLGRILDHKHYHPGSLFPAIDIEDAIKDDLGKRPIVDCLTPRLMEPEEKFLLQIQLCFKEDNDLVDCEHGKEQSEIYPCTPIDSLIEYPVVPKDYYDLLKSL